jgi:5-methylcytosine-specific restriction endonuclease McrA
MPRRKHTPTDDGMYFAEGRWRLTAKERKRREAEIEAEEAAAKAEEEARIQRRKEIAEENRKRWAQQDRKNFLTQMRRTNGTPGRDLTMDQWQAIQAEWDHRCAYCGKVEIPLTMDHVIPVSKGGQHTASNVVPACLRCNLSKGDRPAPPFRKRHAS